VSCQDLSVAGAGCTVGLDWFCECALIPSLLELFTHTQRGKWEKSVKLVAKDHFYQPFKH